MRLNSFLRRSLNARVTLFTLAVFVAGIWSLAFYASQMLRDDLQRMVGDQQFSTVSLLAAAINVEMDQQLKSLEAIASNVTPALLSDSGALQSLLEERQVLQSLFSGGTFLTGTDGTVIADVPRSTGRIGVNFMDRDSIAGALKAGKSMVSRPYRGKQLDAPVFYMTAPIRGPDGMVIAALTGVINLGEPGFLDKITEGRYGMTGGYRLIAPDHRLIVTATDKQLVMSTLPAPGVNSLLDRFILGRDGSGIYINPQGVEVLVSAQRIPASAWVLAAELPTSEAFAPIHVMQQRLLLATICLTLLSAALIGWMLRRQLSPMLAAARSMLVMSKTERFPQALPITSQDEIGTLIGGFNRLLDAMRQRDDALKESEQHFRTLANGGSALVWTSGQDKQCDYFNDPWLRFTGRSLEQEMGNGWTEGIHPDDFEHCLATYVSAYDQHQSFQMDYRIRHADGSYRWISDAGTPRYDTQGGFLGYIGFCMEITERKQFEAALREHSSQLQKLSRRVLEAQETERRRVAIELHDELGQALTAIKINLQAHERFTGQSSAELNAENISIVEDALQQVRRLALALRPSMLDDLGLLPALRWIAQQTEARSHLVVRFHAANLPSRLTPEIETACFRIVQEALNNVVRHAQAQQIEINLQVEAEMLVLSVQDDGCGFEVATMRERALAGGSIGVLGMQERATLIGGQLDIESSVGQGSRVCLRCPLHMNIETI